MSASQSHENSLATTALENPNAPSDSGAPTLPDGWLAVESMDIDAAMPGWGLPPLPSGGAFFLSLLSFIPVTSSLNSLNFSYYSIYVDG